jgi:hypothetical protein
VGTTRYAKSGDLHIAYQAVGEGTLDLLYVPTWIGQIEVLVEEPTHDEERRARIDASVAQWGSGAVPAALAPSKANAARMRSRACRVSGACSR